MLALFAQAAPAVLALPAWLGPLVTASLVGLVAFLLRREIAHVERRLAGADISCAERDALIEAVREKVADLDKQIALLQQTVRQLDRRRDLRPEDKP